MLKTPIKHTIPFFPNSKEEPMSDYESGSPPSRGEMETSSASLGLYSSIPSPGAGATSRKPKSSPPCYAPSRPQAAASHHQSGSWHKQRYSVGGSLDYDYQIRDAREQPARRSLDPAAATGTSFDFPDLRPSIYTSFTSAKFAGSASLPSRQQDHAQTGYDFGQQYKQLFAEHRGSAGSHEHLLVNGGSELAGSAGFLGGEKQQTGYDVSAIWCMDYQENLIVIGCANGSLEFWEGTTGKFKVRTLGTVLFIVRLRFALLSKKNNCSRPLFSIWFLKRHWFFVTGSVRRAPIWGMIYLPTGRHAHIGAWLINEQTFD